MNFWDYGGAKTLKAEKKEILMARSCHELLWVGDLGSALVLCSRAFSRSLGRGREDERISSIRRQRGCRLVAAMDGFLHPSNLVYEMRLPRRIFLKIKSPCAMATYVEVERDTEQCAKSLRSSSMDVQNEEGKSKEKERTRK